MAAQLLATLADLVTYGPPAAVLTGVSSATKTAHLQAASAIALGSVKKRYALPLVEWGSDLVMAVVAIAVCSLLSTRGLDTTVAPDVAILKGRDDAMKWLRDVASGDVELVDLVDSSVAIEEGAPLMQTETAQRWLIPGHGEDE